MKKKKVYLSKSQYWMWRLTIEEMSHSKTKLNMEQARLSFKNCEWLLKDAERKLQSVNVRTAKLGVEKADEEYNRVKGLIEAELNISLKGCVIDEYNYEVKPLDMEEQDGSN